jgi:hypothetical protein
MPCIFCIAAGIMIAAALTSTAVEEIEEKLKGALQDVEQKINTESVAMWKGSARVEQDGLRKNPQIIPVAIHYYKKHDRARIQILTHEISQTDAEALQDLICTTLGAKIVSRQYLDKTDAITLDFKGNQEEIATPSKRRKDRRKRSARGTNHQ